MKRTFFCCCILALIVNGCKKVGDPKLILPTAFIHYVDTTWHDLITDGRNGYIYDSIRLYDYQNGIRTELTSPSVEAPHGYQPNARYPNSGIELGFFNEDIVNRYTVTLVHLKMGVEDTFKVHLTGNYAVRYSDFDSIWYNGVLRKDTFSVMKRY